jgi:hypothetical protein
VTTEVGRARATGVKRRRRLEMNFMMGNLDLSERLLLGATRDWLGCIDLKLPFKRTPTVFILHSTTADVSEASYFHPSRSYTE